MILSVMPAPAEVLVQVMSVQDEAAAGQEASRLFNLGVPAFSRAEESVDNVPRHRVYVGPFETEADAKAAAAALKKNGTIKDFLVKNAEPRAPAQPGAGFLTEAPVLEESIAGLPAAPTHLPVADTPTYGEMVSPEQARSLTGLSGVPQPDQSAAADQPRGLPTYGQMEFVAPPPFEGLPPSLKPGDDLPGLAPEGSALPPVTGKMLAPSAGDGSRPASFEFLMDLSSSMRRPSHCRGLAKEEAVSQLARKMNRRIPNHPYQAAMRVFGYKQALTRADFTTLYYGPAHYSREGFEGAIGRLAAADSVTPISEGLKAADGDLRSLPAPKTLLVFSDFQETLTSGKPLEDVALARRSHGPSLTVHTFYVTRQVEAERLAKGLAKTGGGQAWEVCSLLTNDRVFDNMMLAVFGPDDYICRNAPPGAEVDERGCWIVAYSQYFDFNKAVVKSEFRPKLVEAARIIQENVDPQERVVIAGFTDNVGTAEYNLGLGQRRAQAVADILISEGVSAGRLEVVSYGKERPIADNSTEEGRARNRRVEFHIGEVPGPRPAY